MASALEARHRACFGGANAVRAFRQAVCRGPSVREHERRPEQEAEALARSSDTNLDAYDVLLRGNELLARYSPDANAEARELYLKAIALNPRYSNILLQVEGRILYLLGQYEEAAQRLEEAVQRNPGFHQTHVMLAATYGQLGRIEEAEWEADEVLSLQPGFTISTHLQTQNFRDPALAARYAEGLRKAGLPE